jgi:hypothetical protein
MAPPKTQSQAVASLQTDVALLKQTVGTLEHTVVAQNAATKTELSEIKGVLREIHDKLDTHILAQAVELTNQKAQIKTNTDEIAKIDGRLSRTWGAIIGIFTAIIGGVATWSWWGKT